MNEKEFIKELDDLNIKITSKQLEQLNKYYQVLIEKNKYLNLTRITDKESVYLKHYYDSLTLTKVIDLNNINTLCDVGTGAGFPGIVLKIVFPNLKVTLIDSLNKRVEFLKKIINELNLENITAIHTRSEDHKEKYDLVVSRAVAKLDKLVEYTNHLISNNGYLIAMKANIEEEVDNASMILNKYNLEIKEIKNFKLIKENSNRNLIVIRHKK